MNKLRTVRGVHDLLPEALNKHNLVIKAGLNISGRFCYNQIDTPIFEFAEVFTKPLGHQIMSVIQIFQIFPSKSLIRKHFPRNIKRVFKFHDNLGFSVTNYYDIIFC